MEGSVGMGDWLNPAVWNQVPFEDEMKGPVAITFLIVFALGFVASLLLYLRPPAQLKTPALKRRLVTGYASWLLWAFGFGLVSYLFQLMGLPFLGWRVWTWVSALVVVAVVAYIAYHWRTRYRSQLAAYEAQQAKRYYQQQARKRPVGADGAPVPRSPRAEKRRQRTTGPAAKNR